MSRRIRSQSLLLLLSLLPLITAQITMQEVQAIVNFPESCINAYSTPLSSCTADMFRGNGGTGQCSQDCFNQLSDLTGTVQSACAGQKASGGTLIGHFFVGDANTFLCGFEPGTGTETTTAAATTSISETVVSSASTAEASTTTTLESSSSSSPKTTTTKSISTSTKVTTTTLQTSTKSTDTSSISSSSSTSAVATAGQNNQQIGITGGGSPFDVILPAAAPSVRGSISMAVLLGFAIAAVMVGR